MESEDNPAVGKHWMEGSISPEAEDTPENNEEEPQTVTETTAPARTFKVTNDTAKQNRLSRSLKSAKTVAYCRSGDDSGHTGEEETKNRDSAEVAKHPRLSSSDESELSKNVCFTSERDIGIKNPDLNLREIFGEVKSKWNVSVRELVSYYEGLDQTFLSGAVGQNVTQGSTSSSGMDCQEINLDEGDINSNPVPDFFEFSVPVKTEYNSECAEICGTDDLTLTDVRNKPSSFVSDGTRQFEVSKCGFLSPKSRPERDTTAKSMYTQKSVSSVRDTCSHDSAFQCICTMCSSSSASLDFSTILLNPSKTCNPMDASTLTNPETADERDIHMVNGNGCIKIIYEGRLQEIKNVAKKEEPLIKKRRRNLVHRRWNSRTIIFAVFVFGLASSILSIFFLNCFQ